MNIDWANCILTIFAAGFGAWGAYRFNIRQENKSQKEIEKAQLTQLFYDLHILSKYIYEYGINATKVANNIVNKHEYDVLQLSIYSKVIEIDKFGFITKKSNKMYEILAHTRMDANAFIV